MESNLHIFLCHWYLEFISSYNLLLMNNRRERNFEYQRYGPLKMYLVYEMRNPDLYMNQSNIFNPWTVFMGERRTRLKSMK